MHKAFDLCFSLNHHCVGVCKVFYMNLFYRFRLSSEIYFKLLPGAVAHIFTRLRSLLTKPSELYLDVYEVRHSTFFLLSLELTAQNRRRNNACLKLYKKVTQPNHLLHHLLYTKPTPTRLKSRSFLRPQQEQFYKETTDSPPPPVPPLNNFLAGITTKPSGFFFPRKAWVQLNRLHTGVGRLASNIFNMGLADSNPSGLIQSENMSYKIVLSCAHLTASTMFPTRNLSRIGRIFPFDYGMMVYLKLKEEFYRKTIFCNMTNKSILFALLDISFFFMCCN